MECPDNGNCRDVTDKTLDELRKLLANETAQLRGAVNWTIEHVCSAEDRKAIMELDNYATECTDLTCSLHIMQQEVRNYVRFSSNYVRFSSNYVRFSST